MGSDLAQVNVSRLLAPLDSPLLAEFMAALDDVNADGDAAAGFLWRLQTEDGNPLRCVPSAGTWVTAMA